MAEERVCQTAQRFSLIHAWDTALKTRNAWDHVLQPSFQSFFRHLRICQALTSKGNQISPALPHQKFSVLRFRKTAYRDDRNRHSTLDLCDKVRRKASMDRSRCPHIFIADMY